MVPQTPRRREPGAGVTLRRMPASDRPATDPVAEPAWVGQVLDFWFVQCTPRDWFTRDAAFDGRLHARFGALHERLAAGAEHVPDSARGLLAAVVVLDQFSRNLHRDGARAFATDAEARRLADAALARGFDRDLSTAQRLFLALPFEHSENLADQDRALALVAPLGNADWLRYAQAHRDIIARFGRFPHRNAVLGRASTADELALLAQPMGSF
jgi:uncharacterized protein (DUF924 family)